MVVFLSYEDEATGIFYFKDLSKDTLLKRGFAGNDDTYHSI